MILKITLLFICLLSTGCASLKPETVADVYSVYKTAPAAGSLLRDYLGDDEKSLKAIEAPLASFQVLYEQLDELDMPLSEFLTDNRLHSPQLVNNWNLLIAAVSEYSNRTGQVIPPELNTYRQDVESSYKALVTQARAGNKAATVEKYGAIILKIIAAKNGVIL